MAKAPQLSTKRLAISKANAQMVIFVAVASFVSIFCLVASNSVFSQNRYQQKVISAKEKAHKQLETNITNYNTLAQRYKSFNSQSPNVIGGSANGTGDNDGPNSTIVLDALPDTYDFPALTSSMEKILSDRGLKVTSISGTDDQLAQQNNTSSPTPQPVSIPFSFTVNDADYSSIANLASALDHSIRPIAIDTISLTGGAHDMTATFTAHTYWEPAKSLKVTEKVVK